MGFEIEDGTGKGYKTQVDKDNNLHTRAIRIPFQQFISEDKGQAYSIWGTASLVNSTTVGLHIKNTHSTKDLSP